MGGGALENPEGYPYAFAIVFEEFEEKEGPGKEIGRKKGEDRPEGPPSTRKEYDRFRSWLADKCRERGMDVKEERQDKKDTLLVTAGFRALVREAADMNMVCQLHRLTPELRATSEGRRGFLNPAEHLEVVINMIQTIQITDEDRKEFKLPDEHHIRLIEFLEGKGVEAVVPIHEVDKKLILWKRVISSLKIRAPLINDIRAYYGEEIGFYFSFMSFYERALVFPAVMGLSIYLASWQWGLNVDTNPLIPAYSLFMAFWAALFVRFWDRHSARVALGFGTYHLDDTEHVRQEYWGTQTIYNHSGKEEPYFPESKRLLRYLVSLIVTLVMLTLAVFVMMMSLNVQGYMKPHYFGWISWLENLSEPGMLFDKETNWGFIPSIMHAVVIGILNAWYRDIATKLNDFENHRTETDYMRALTAKRLCFEFCDCFLVLFYVGFYCMDIVALRTELVSLFMVDQFRRVATESIVPWLIYRGKRNHHKYQVKKETKEKVNEAEYIKELAREEYESFDDYLEVVMQFGYLTMFASAMPLASCIALVSNYFEVRSDAFKLAFVVRRPVPIRAKELLPWSSVLGGFALMSVVTNSILFGFTSHQIKTFMPEGFQSKMDKAEFQYEFTFAVEHVVMALVLLILHLLKPVPSDVTDELKRESYSTDFLLMSKLDGMQDYPEGGLDQPKLKVHQAFQAVARGLKARSSSQRASGLQE